jgi:hypothetical protein
MKRILRLSARVIAIICGILLAANVGMLLLAVFDHYANHHQFPSSVPRIIADTVLLSLGFLLSLITFFTISK